MAGRPVALGLRGDPIKNKLGGEGGISPRLSPRRRSARSRHRLIRFACWQNMIPAFKSSMRRKQLRRSLLVFPKKPSKRLLWKHGQCGLSAQVI